MTEKKCDRKYKVGEVLRFDLTATSSLSTDIVVMTDARWALKREPGSVVIAQGQATIDGNKASFLVPFSKSGHYVLECFAEVPPETLASVVSLEVQP